MPRFAGVSAGVLLPVAVVVALSGCSSPGDDKAQPTGKPSAPAAPAASTSASQATGAGQDTGGAHGRIDYTGAVTGGFDVTSSVGCRILMGELKAVTAPDADTDEGAAGFAVPSFLTTTGNMSVTTLVTPDNQVFDYVGAKGVSAEKQGDTWTVTVSGMELSAEDGSGRTVKAFGYLTCTKTHGTEAP